MPIESIKIMIVDDEADDAFITTRCIKKGLQCADLSIDHAGSFSELEARLERSAYDLFLIDYHLGEFTGLEVMRVIRRRGIKAPMVLLTGQGDERVAVAAMKAGASDYLSKETLSPEILSNTIRYSMELFQAEALRYKTEKSLKRSEEKYRTIINTTTEGYWAFDPDLRTIDLNASLCLMLGYSREEILALRPDKLIEKKRRIPFKGAMKSILSSHHKSFETVLKTKDGQSLHTLFNATSIRSRKGKILQVFAFVTDISRQKEAEETLKRANESLKKLDLMKSDFVSNVSHELRTPLTSIKNAITILAKGKAGALNETQEGFLKMAARNIDRLAELLNDVLDLSKLEAGKVENRPSELKLSKLLQNITLLFKDQAKEKGLQFEVGTGQNLPPVYADADRVEQVLCNLLSNAMKFTHGGGRVSLSLVEEEGWLTICVSDTGPGLSSKDQERVFERFYQVGDSLGQTLQGTGLGLSIARELVTMQGGTMGVQSEIGQGCRFFFTLPVFSKQAVEMAALEKVIRAFPKDSIFSLVLVAVHSVKSDQGNTSEHEITHQIGDMIRQILREDDDLIIAQSAFGRILCLLPDTPKIAAMRVVERLEERLALKRIVLQGGRIVHPEVFNPLAYPADGTTGKSLIVSATSRKSIHLSGR